MQVKEAANKVIQEVTRFWERARIPMKASHHARDKVISLHSEWSALKKNRTRRTALQQRNEEAFATSLEHLFDVAHENAFCLINIEEDRKFLQAQRENVPRGTMAGEDRTLTSIEARMKQRQDHLQQRREAEAARRAAEEKTELFSSSSSSSSTTSSPVRPRHRTADPTAEENQESGPSTFSDTVPTPAKQRRGTAKLMTAEITAAMDRARLSNRDGVHLLATIASTLGHDPVDLALNRESIRRRRREFRMKIAEEIKESFKPSVPLAVHWDGKLVPDFKDPRHKRVERLPILVSGEDVGKLLAVPRLPAGTGDEIAKAVVDTLEDWGVKERVVAMSFDTTASNTGRLAGACVKIQEKLGRPLLWLACRHHIFELVLAKAFRVSLGPSAGPDVGLFRRFEEHWDFIDR